MIVAVPVFFAVTLPFDIVATLLFDVVHVSVLLAVLLGRVAFKIKDSPTPRVNAVLFRVTFDGAALTVILQVAVFPLKVLTVIVAVPVFFAVTLPLDTVAMLLFDVVHVSVLLAVSLGRVSFKVNDSPTPRVNVVLFRVTFDGAALTVILQVAVFPLKVLTVIVAVPVFFAVTLPLDTVAMLLFDVVHVSVLLAVSLGRVAFKANDSPTPRVNAVLFIVTFDGAALTVILHVAVFPLKVFTVMVAVPVFFAITLPLDTVAILLFDVVHVTVLFVAFEGEIVAVRLTVSPTPRIAVDLLRNILVAEITELFTVTEQVAVFPLAVFAVIVAVPTDTAVTLPFDTVATLLLLVVQVTVLFVVSNGVIVAVSVRVLPVSIVSDVLLSFIDVAGITGSLTVSLSSDSAKWDDLT